LNIQVHCEFRGCFEIYQLFFPTRPAGEYASFKALFRYSEGSGLNDNPAILKIFTSSCQKKTYNPKASGLIIYFKTVSKPKK
jgi:hypothetical protein